jgi:hypothetical protein
VCGGACAYGVGDEAGEGLFDVSLGGARVGDVEHDHVGVGRELARRVADVDGRLLAVARQHPDLDAGLRQLDDRLRHAVLQLVLDARRAQQHQVLLDLLRHLR